MTLAFVTHHECVVRQPIALLSSSKPPPRREPDDDLAVTVVDRVAKVILQPTPGFPDLSLGYPFALLTATLVFPLSTAFLLAVFFAGYAFLGRQVVPKEDGVYLAAFLAAIPSAGLLSPSGFMAKDGNTGSVISLVAILGLGLAAASFVQALPSEDEKLLDEWDDKFDNEYRDE